MNPNTKVKIIAGASERVEKIGTVTDEKGNGRNRGKIPVYLELGRKTGTYWYEKDELEVLEELKEKPASPKIIILAIKKIQRDGGTQIREKIDEATVSDYAEDMRSGAVFPAVTVYFDGACYWLSDGYHRVLAAETIGTEEIPAEIRQGSQRDAILHSCGANASHGLRRTNQDKKNSVLRLLHDPEWKSWSDREVSRKCKVSQPFVSKIRQSLTDNIISEQQGVTDNQREDKQRIYKTKHGTIAVMNTAQIGKSSNQREFKQGDSIRVKPSYSLLAGQYGTIVSLPNQMSAIVQFEGNKRELINIEHLELESGRETKKNFSSSESLLELPNLSEQVSHPEVQQPMTPPHTHKKSALSQPTSFSSVSEELEEKQKQLGLKYNLSSDQVLPDVKRNYDNPTDAQVDDRAFVYPIAEPETINPNAIVNNFINQMEYLGTSHLKVVAKAIAIHKFDALEDVAVVLAQSPERAEMIVRAIANIYPDVARKVLQEN